MKSSVEQEERKVAELQRMKDELSNSL